VITFKYSESARFKILYQELHVIAVNPIGNKNNQASDADRTLISGRPEDQNRWMISGVPNLWQNTL